jgi:hypothetical protein
LKVKTTDQLPQMLMMKKVKIKASICNHRNPFMYCNLMFYQQHRNRMIRSIKRPIKKL